MARNYVQPGDVLDVTATAALTSGTPVAIGSLVGVPLSSAAVNTTAAVAVSGVFDLPKATGTAFTVGQRLNFRPSTGNFMVGATVAGDLVGAGVAIEAATAAATVARVRLNTGVATIA